MIQVANFKFTSVREVIILSRDPNPWFYTAAKDRLTTLPPVIFFKDFERVGDHISSKSFEKLAKLGYFRFVINLESSKDIKKWDDLNRSTIQSCNCQIGSCEIP